MMPDVSNFSRQPLALFQSLATVEKLHSSRVLGHTASVAAVVLAISLLAACSDKAAPPPLHRRSLRSASSPYSLHRSS